MSLWHLSYKMPKDPFLFQAMKDNKKACAAKLLHKLKYPSAKLALGFLR